MAYFSNGTEGEVLYAQCGDCPLNGGPDENTCEVLTIHEVYNYDQTDDGQEKLAEVMSMLVGGDGVCRIRLRARGGRP